MIENSQFDNNQDGFDTNTQIAGDPPAPQNGACPDGGTSPITHTHSCWVFMHNYVHDNNNPNVPEAGTAAPGPTGTGMTLSGGRNDTVMDNTFSNNGAWGFLDRALPRLEHAGVRPVLPGHRRRGVRPASAASTTPMNDALLHNTFTNNGSSGTRATPTTARSRSTADQP